MTDWEAMRAPTPPATGGPPTLPRPPGQRKAAHAGQARAWSQAAAGPAGPAAARILRRGQQRRRLTHIEHIPARPGQPFPGRPGFPRR